MHATSVSWFSVCDIITSPTPVQSNVYQVLCCMTHVINYCCINVLQCLPWKQLLCRSRIVRATKFPISRGMIPDACTPAQCPTKKRNTDIKMIWEMSQQCKRLLWHALKVSPRYQSWCATPAFCCRNILCPRRIFRSLEEHVL